MSYCCWGGGGDYIFDAALEMPFARVSHELKVVGIIGRAAAET